MSQTCTKCSHVNPDDASYCYYDGQVLAGHSANGGPVNAGSQPFPSPFVFPSGQSCRNFDQLATACQNSWKEAVNLLKQGFLSGFLGGLGRADLARAAQDAARFPDADRGLDQMLDKLPTQVLEKPKLLVEPTEVNLGVVQLGGDRQFDLHLANQGMRLLYGSVVSDCKWLTLGEAPGNAQKLFQFGNDATIPVQVRGQHLRAGSKALEGHLVIESNGGSVTLTVKAEVPVRPFKDGVLAGAISPRQVAEKAKASPKEAAALFEKGAVAAWFKENGWTYPVQGPSASGLGAVQQFFEALGLATAPKVEVTQKALQLRGDPGQMLNEAIEVKTQEKRPVYAHATSDLACLDVSKTDLNGRVAIVRVKASVPNQPGTTLQGRITIQANGNQRFVIPVTLQIGRGRGFIANLQPEVPEAIYPEAMVAIAAPAPARAAAGPVVMAIAAEPVVAAAVPAGSPFDFGNEPVVQAVMVPAGRAAPPPPAPLIARRQREKQPTSVLMFVLPALLLLALLGVIVKDIFFTAALPSDDDVIDPNPKIGIHFSDSKNGDETMRFGLTTSEGKKLTFHKYGASNSTMVSLDGGKKYLRFGSGADGAWKTMAGETGSKWTGKKSVWLSFNEKIQVTQLVELVPGDPIDVDGKGQFKRYLDTCRVRYILENKDNKEHRVGLRVMVDTMIGSNDGVPFLIPGRDQLITEFFDAHGGAKDPIPEFFQALERPNLKNPGVVGFFNLRLGGDVEPPTRVSLTRWVQPEMWIYDQQIRPFFDAQRNEGDSEVVLYWGEKSLAPGTKREIGYSYGLGDVSSKSGALAITIGGDKTPGKELTVTALVENPKAGEKLTLKLQDGMKLKEGFTSELAVPPPAAGTQSSVTWRIEATKNGSFDVEVSSTSGAIQKKRVVIKQAPLF
jgi:hypothetical protein